MTRHRCGGAVSLAAISLAAVSLAGCAIPASRTVIEPVQSAALGLAGAPAPLVAGDWWTGFGDPQLNRLVTDAQAGSPTLAVALTRVRQAEAILSSRRADNGPDVTLNGSLQETRLSGRYTIPPPYAGTVRTVGMATANLDWNLDLFGRQRAAIDAARASIEAARLDTEAARLAIAGAVTQTYIDVVRAEAQTAIAQRTIATRQESLRLVRVQIRNKLASNLQASAAETLLAQAKTALVRATGARVLAVNALAALAGRGPDYAATIGRATLKLDTALVAPASVPADLLSRRADIAAAQARIAAAGAGRQVARRAFYPNINLAALAGFQAIGLGNLFGLDAGTAGVGPAIRLPLFDNGRLSADLAASTAALDLATANYNERVVGAVREVADAIALVGNLQAQQAQNAAVVRGFAETDRLNGIRVASGLDTKLDLVDNDVRLLDAQLTQANLVADTARQRVALVMALGGGFTPDQEPAR